MLSAELASARGPVCLRNELGLRLPPSCPPAQYGQTGTGKTHTMLGVDMWRLAEKGGDGGRADAGLLSGVADAVSSGALQPGTPAYADVVDRLMAYDGDYHPDWGLIPRAMAYVFRRLQIGAAAVATVGGSQRHSPASYSSPASRARRRSTLAPGRASMSPGPGGFGGRLPDGVKVTVTYLEIYNERVYDLLRPPDDDDGPAHGPTPAARSKPAPSLDIVNDPTRGVCVPDAVAVPVTNEAEVLALLWEGARNRVLASTDMNEHSSRSHTIWQVGVERRHRRGAGAGDSPRRVGGDASSPASSGRSGGEAAGTSDLGDGEMVVSRSKVSLVDLVRRQRRPRPRTEPHNVGFTRQRWPRPSSCYNCPPPPTLSRPPPPSPPFTRRPARRSCAPTPWTPSRAAASRS